MPKTLGGICWERLGLMQNFVIVVAGPTASGKSQLAIDLALYFNGAVVNADSMQVYKNTPIIAACPNENDKKIVPHYLYEMWDASFNSSVVDWASEAVKCIHDLWQNHKIPMLVGGTGLYLDALINGVTPIPETKPEVKKKVAEMLKHDGVSMCHQLLSSFDAENAAKLSCNDTTRVRRALEVYFDTGKKLSDWHKQPMKKLLPSARFFVISLLPDKAELDERCFLRFDKMIAQGALDEIKALSALSLNDKLPAMRALGVPELLGYVRGKYSLEDAIESAKLHTRQYAKRQRTWFKNKLKADAVIHQCYLGQKEILENLIYDVKKML